MKKNPYQFTIRFNSTIAGHCQAAAFLNRCGTRAKAHVIAEALDLYLREKKQLNGAILTKLLNCQKSLNKCFHVLISRIFMQEVAVLLILMTNFVKF